MFDDMDTPDVLAWRDGHIEALDQTALPHQVRVLRITTVDGLIKAITTLAVRGAPVLGAAGALGVALAVHQGMREGWDGARLDAEIKRIADARPTAVNLRREVAAVAACIPQGRPSRPRRWGSSASPSRRASRSAGAVPPTSGMPAEAGGSASTRTATPGAWPAWAGARRSG